MASEACLCSSAPLLLVLLRQRVSGEEQSHLWPPGGREREKKQKTGHRPSGDPSSTGLRFTLVGCFPHLQETLGSGVQDPPQQYSEFKASLGYQKTPSIEKQHRGKKEGRTSHDLLAQQGPSSDNSFSHDPSLDPSCFPSRLKAPLLSTAMARSKPSLEV